MKFRRVIPCLLLKHGLIVRSQLFKVHQDIGNPMSTVSRFSDWNVDELIVLDISSKVDRHDLRREDLHQSYSGSNTVDVLSEIAKVCSMPLTFGGQIRTLKDIEQRLQVGADKVTINSAAYLNPQFVEEAVARFGSQCIVASIDCELLEGSHTVKINSGRTDIQTPHEQWAEKLESLGIGEILLNSIDRDGSARGLDHGLISKVVDAVSIPVVAMGGIGTFDHFAEGFTQGQADAVAAANIFHFQELSYHHAKYACTQADVHIRPSTLGSKYLRREPIYDQVLEAKKRESRIEQSKIKDYSKWKQDIPRVTWCSKCLYPSLSATPLEFDEEGVCTGCQMAEVKVKIPKHEWQRRKQLLIETLEKYRSKDKSRHDIIIAVSGGKDSYYQAHVLKEEFGMNPLLVTYDGNNWSDVGWRNMVKMKDVFNCDHIVVRPSVKTLKKLNKQAFITMGDMNWHGHIGIMSVPMMVAVEKQIPLVFYGEHGYLDLCGQFSMNDFPEVTYRDRLEHYGRCYEWTYFDGVDGLTASDLVLYRYPSDQQILDLDLRGLYLGNYLHWEANEHTQFVIDHYNFEVADQTFDRTYRTMSNLDDIHENGGHDYLKYIKFGYGRCTDHVSKDIRAGIMSREEAIKRVNHYDPVRPSDLERWVNYSGMTHQEFDDIADTFRDPRVWAYKKGKWLRKELIV